VLIVIGVGFLLANLGVIELRNFGYWFAHYWPVLLILWGIVKLIEYQQATGRGQRAPGIGGGGVVLIVFLVLGGLIATGVSRHWDELGETFHWNDSDLPWWGHSYNYTDNLEQAFPNGGSLHVTSERGAINISAADDNRIHVSVHKRINADRQEEADRWSGSTRPQISTTGQVVSINANTHGAGDHWVSTDLDISLPRKAAVVLSTRHGDISIMGRDGNAEVKSAEGDVSVSDLNGSLTLNLDGSSARISQVSSNVTIQGHANDVSLEDIQGAVRLDGDFMESVKLSRIAKPVSFRTSRTDMDFTKLDGDLTLDSGDLQATDVSGPLRLSTRSKDIMLNGVTNDVHLQNENGAVEVHLNKLGSLEVTNSKGDIRVFVPQKAGFSLDAQARDGEIQSDFNSLKIANGDNRATAFGTINGGGPHMVLNNEHGTIEIRAGNVVSDSVPNPPHPPRTPNSPQPTEN
jgi:DUF4097 and DUF4098 domain-containing protein YvlB